MKRFLSAILAAVLLFSVVSCDRKKSSSSNETDGSVNETSSETEAMSDTGVESETESNTDTESGDESEEKNGVIYPEDGAKIILANDEVYGWWDKFNYKKTDSEPFYRHEDIYYPNAVNFSWEAHDGVDYYRLFLSTDASFSEDSTESYLVNTNSLSLSHLFVGTKYYWKVIGTRISDTGEEINSNVVYTAKFTTKDSPRCLEIEGVSNTRDIGGIELKDGKRIKQGMIYRGGKLEGITEEGKEFFLNYLGLATDLDLRTPGEGGAGSISPLGSSVKYVNIDGRYYTGSKGITNDLGKELFAQEIRLFANPDNYPIYIHCSLGRDRTGTLVMVLEGLLGANINYLMMDYELSVFSVTGTLDNASISAIRNNIKATYDYINNNYEGANFSEKTENYLLSIGITAEEIQTIRDLLIEEV